MFTMHGKELIIDKKDSVFTVFDKFKQIVANCVGDSVHKSNFIQNVQRELTRNCTSYVEVLEHLGKYVTITIVK